MTNLYRVKDGKRCAHGVLDPTIQKQQTGSYIIGCTACEAQAIVNDRDRLALENARLLGLLRQALPYVSPSDHEGRSESELREEYPTAHVELDALRAAIIKALEDAP